MTDMEVLAPAAERLWSDLEELASYVESAPGWTRRVFSEPYRASRSWTRARMADAGLEVTEDVAGNLVGRLPGSVPGAPALVTGSHTDTVHGGGRFDGIVGVLGGIEVARRLRETGTRLRHELRVVDFLGEEPNPHGNSCIGSRALTGRLTPDLLSQVDGRGASLGATMESYGLDPSAALRASWRSSEVAAFVELHVEQGPVLEREGVEIGVVTAIAGFERMLATFTGRPDHAGTAAMADRRDALIAAADAVLTVEQVGCGAAVASAAGGVATTGRIEVAPNAVNVVPGGARVWSEIRSTDPAWLSGARAELTSRLLDGARERGVEVDVDWLVDQEPVPASADLPDVVAAAAAGLGRSWRTLPSGAGHDAAHMARLGPMGMIFVPSRDGRSHCPEEFTDGSAIAAGVHVLAATLVSLDPR